MSLPTLLANLQHAIRSDEIVIIGGGEFNPSELKELEALLVSSLSKD